MSNHKNQNIIKYCFISSTAGILFIAASLVPLSKNAIYWNRCLKQTVIWIEGNEMDLKDWGKEAIESLAVAVCNGAVYEPNLKSN